jgi:hypothetical protein
MGYNGINLKRMEWEGAGTIYGLEERWIQGFGGEREGRGALRLCRV